MGKHLSDRGKVWLAIVFGCLMVWLVILLWGLG